MSTSNDLRLEHWPLDRLIPSARNARTHSPAQVAEIAGSIRAFGFSNPILVGEDGDIVAGHGRLAAARQLGLTEVPVVVLIGLTDLQRRQLLLADNRIALNAGWDLEMLHLELKELTALGADLEAWGFTTQELARVLTRPRGTGLTDEDEIPELAENAVSRPGDVWCAGPHRIACGDSTDADAVSKLLGGITPHLLVTDQPYGVNYDPAWRHRLGVNRSVRRGKVRNDTRADWEAAWVLFRGDIAYVWHGALHATTVAESLRRQGFDIRAQIIWAKERLVLGRGDYHWQHEPCWYACAQKVIGPAIGSRRRCGAFRAGTRIARRNTVPKSPSNACGGLCRTTAVRDKRFTIHSLAVARPSSQQRRLVESALAWSWSRPSSTSRCAAGRPSRVRRRLSSVTADCSTSWRRNGWMRRRACPRLRKESTEQNHPDDRQSHDKTPR